jgi:type VI secretion system protein ImpA
VDSGNEAVARPLLQEMEKQIERHELEQWEPRTIVAQPLSLLYRCRQKLDSRPDLDDLFERISRLDPLAGLKLDHRSDD